MRLTEFFESDEITREQLLQAVSQEGVNCVEAETSPENTVSQRVLAKAGFIPMGENGEEGPRFRYE